MQKVLVKIKITIKKEPVLSIAVILAVISMFVVHPDDTYVSYIDFRTLAILFCLMVIVAGIREIGVFDYIAQSLLNRVKSISGIVMILVLLCFFLSMVITNDVALITFVPFAILILKRFPKEVRCHWLIPCVVMQTAAANLGSMMTPIGNPQPRRRRNEPRRERTAKENTMAAKNQNTVVTATQKTEPGAKKEIGRASCRERV